MGKKVFAHANGRQAIMKAVQAGVDFIVDGFYIDAECAEMILEKDVVLEPTAMVIKVICDYGTGEMPDVMLEKAREYWKLKEKEFAIILEKGVSVSFSSDMGCPFLYHGENARELAACVELGMTPMLLSCRRQRRQPMQLAWVIRSVRLKRERLQISFW